MTKSLLGQASGQKFVFLEKCARIYLAEGRDTTCQLACSAHVQTEGSAIFMGDGKEGVSSGNIHVVAQPI
jgi:hypothetical protein